MDYKNLSIVTYYQNLRQIKILYSKCRVSFSFSIFELIWFDLFGLKCMDYEKKKERKAKTNALT